MLLKLSTLLLFLIFTQLYFFTPVSASRYSRRSKNSSVTIRNLEAAPQPSDDSESLTIIPGQTQRLVVDLKGDKEEIIFDFQADHADVSIFQIFVILNGHNDSAPYMTQFTESETLSVSLDYDSQRVLITGNKGFSLKSPIEEGNYQINSFQNRNPPQKHQPAPTPIGVSNEESPSFLTLGATVGVCGVLMLTVKIGLDAKRRRAALLEDLSSVTQQHEDLKKQQDEQVYFASRVLMEKTYRKEDGYVASLNESPEFKADYEAAKGKEKRITPKSVASTAATLNILTPPAAYKPTVSFPTPNNKSINDISACNLLKNTDKSEIIQDCTDRCDKSPCNSKSPCKSQKASPCQLKTLEQIRTRPFEEDKAVDGFTLSLDFDSDGDDGGKRRNPTQDAIRSLVRRMKEEGTIGQDCDPSAESEDDEDQYEAPQLPNYFCCMLCFQGKRSTVAHPCRHVFACTDCIEGLLDTYKICVLCARNITGYEPL